MRVDILTIFPEMFKGPLTESIIKRACEKRILDINISDIRSFTTDKHRIVDDKSFGGGPGMVMKAEPIYKALKSTGALTKTFQKGKNLVVYLSPQGKTLNQKMVKKLSSCKRIVFLCGHYEGIDERVMNWVDEEVSIGDYVLTGGEIPAMVVVDAIARMLPGVIKQEDSVTKDSFYSGLLDFPHYTRPEKFMGLKVPDVLISGHHKKIDAWRKKQSLLNTYKKRKDIFKIYKQSKEDKKLMSEIKKTLREK